MTTKFLRPIIHKSDEFTFPLPISQLSSQSPPPPPLSQSPPPSQSPQPLQPSPLPSLPLPSFVTEAKYKNQQYIVNSLSQYIAEAVRPHISDSSLIHQIQEHIISNLITDCFSRTCKGITSKNEPCKITSQFFIDGTDFCKYHVGQMNKPVQQPSTPQTKTTFSTKNYKCSQLNKKDGKPCASVIGFKLYVNNDNSEDKVIMCSCHGRYTKHYRLATTEKMEEYLK